MSFVSEGSRDSTRRYFGILCPPRRSAAAATAAEDGLPSRSSQPACRPSLVQSGQGEASRHTTSFRGTVEAPDRATHTSAGQRVDRRISRTFCLVKRLSSPPARPWAVPAPLAGQSASPEDEGAWNEECRRYHHLAVQDLSGELAASPPARGRAR